MPKKSAFFVTGVVVLLAIFSAVGFSLWLYSKSGHKNVAHYNLYFNDSVAGLTVGSPVKYKGLLVGRVHDIVVDPARAGAMRVEITVTEKNLMRRGVKGYLSMAGITGNTYVSLTGGDLKGPPLKASRKGEVPEVPTQESSIEKIFKTTPHLLENADALIQRVQEIVRPENQKNVQIFLENLAQLSGTLHQRMPPLLDQLETFVEKLNEKADGMETLFNNANHLAKKTEAFVGRLEKSAHLLDDALQSGKNAFDDASQFMAEGKRTLKEVAPNLTHFSENGLVHLTTAAEKFTDSLTKVDQFMALLETRIRTLLPNQLNRTYELT